MGKRGDMRINLSRAQADDVYRGEYCNRLLSYIKDSNSPHDPNWWLTRPKPASSSECRRPAAVRAYLSLSEHAALTLPERIFPAVFGFNDGTRARVDKGTVKQLLVHNLLDYLEEHRELLFRLTTRGVEWLNQAPAH